MSVTTRNGSICAYSDRKKYRARLIARTERECVELFTRHGSDVPWVEVAAEYPARAALFAALCQYQDGLTASELAILLGIDVAYVSTILCFMRDYWHLINGPGPTRRRGGGDGRARGVWTLNRS